MRHCPDRPTRCKFDPETHRCSCGRWQRGFKPKCDPVKPRAECQICEAEWALNGGLIGHHGYKRPGYGFIEGDCFGVAHAPYPATDALVKYLVALRTRLSSLDGCLAELPTLQTLPYEYSVYDRGRKVGVDRITVARGSRAAFAPVHVPSFADLEASRHSELTVARDMVTREITRVETRIATASQ